MPETQRRSSSSDGAGDTSARELKARLFGTVRGAVVQELFTNSAHYPLANLLLEALHEGWREYVAAPDLYSIITGTVVQAWFLGRSRHAGRPRSFLGNLIGPAVYSVIEVAFEGLAFFASANHVAYWAFSLLVGLLQAGRERGPRWWRDALIVIESAARASILVVLYWIFEARTDPGYATTAAFVAEPVHLFVILVAPLLGVLIGIAHLAGLRHLDVLGRTAAQLRQMSEWAMGRELASTAVVDPTILELRRIERAVLFMDIRGFTRWSDTRPPEVVVAMLDDYFAAAERVWSRHSVVRARLIADEVMIIAPSAEGACALALDLGTEVTGALRSHGLDVGIGVNVGPLIEGLIGSGELKAYDVIGDTVNVAKRICSAAAGGEILVPAGLTQVLGPRFAFGPAQTIEAKGKEGGLAVRALGEVPPASRT